MAEIVERLLAEVTPLVDGAHTEEVRIGLHWTCVVITRAGESYGGLATTLRDTGEDHHHGGRYPVADAGHLHTYAVSDLLALARSGSSVEASVGFATLNALLACEKPEVAAPSVSLHKVNAAEVLAERGSGKSVAMVGHFPFAPRLRQVAREFAVLELQPRGDDLPARLAPEVLPQADVVALTGTTLLNNTCERLLSHCRPGAYVMMLGATTPLSPVLLEAGVSALAGTRVVDVEAVLRAVGQGATFRQIPGKQLLTLFAT